MQDSRDDTINHIVKVRNHLWRVAALLVQRGDAHDASKLEEPEKSGYDQLATRLQDIVYGSDEYKQALVAAKPVIDHHYTHNSHHPEHYPNGINGMSLLDVIEMLCDWKAAGERTKNGSITRSLAVNRERFGISDQLFAILENTVRELGWE